MSRRVLITGASGLLGRAIYREFKAAGDWEVMGLAFSRTKGGLVKVDITDQDAVNKVISEFKPNVVIHSAAERKVDVIEKNPDAARKTNVDATKFICEAAASVNAWVLYISTDYVFDGKNPPYKVTDATNPLNSYGKSKVEGELVTMQVNKCNSILRVPILYGQIESLEESAVTVLFEKVKDTSKPAKMCSHQRRFPTHCDDVAYVIRKLAEKRLETNTLDGIFHWSNNENMTKYDMAVIMAQQLGLPSDHIVADPNAGGGNRPQNAQLDCSRVEELGINKRTPFAEGIKAVLGDFLK